MRLFETVEAFVGTTVVVLFLLGWHNALNLRWDNGEEAAYDVLTKTFKQHQQNLTEQLLSFGGLSRNWSSVIIPLVEQIVDRIQPGMFAPRSTFPPTVNLDGFNLKTGTTTQKTWT